MKRKRPLTRFESLAQKLVEGSFKRLFGEQLEPYEVAARLAQVMEDFTLNGLAPNHFAVVLAVADQKALLDQYPALSEQMAAYLTTLAQQADFRLAGSVEVSIPRCRPINFTSGPNTLTSQMSTRRKFNYARVAKRKRQPLCVRGMPIW